MVTFYMFPMLALIFGASVLNMAEGLKCTVEVQDITWNFVPGRDTSRYGIPTVQDCKDLCSKAPDCKGYTWRYDDIASWCYEFAELEGIHHCEDCYGGTVPIMFEGACVVASPENILDEISTESSDECYLSCVGTEGCSGFTWFDKSSIFPNFCFMYNECPSVNPTPGTVSGSLNCIDHQCFNYMELNSEKRNEHFKFDGTVSCDSINKENHLPDWQGTGYYRFVEPAGVMLSTKTPGPYHCRTFGSMYLDDADNVLPNIPVWDEVDAFVCMDNSDDGTCQVTRPITITKCPGDFFVYYFMDIHPGACAIAFCGTLEE